MEEERERKIAHRVQTEGTQFGYLVQLEPRVPGERWVTDPSSLEHQAKAEACDLLDIS